MAVLPSWSIPENGQGEFETFYDMLRPLLRFSQFFGLFPTLILTKDRKDAIYTWKSWRCIYTLYTVVGSAFLFVTNFYPVFSGTFSYAIFSGSFFYLVSFLIQLVLLRLSGQWLELCQQFLTLDRLFRRHGALKLHYKFKVFIVVFFTSAAIEHLAAIMSSVARIWPCFNSSHNVLDRFHGYISNFRAFQAVDYNHWLGVIVFTNNTLCTFFWNFADALLITIAVVVSERLRQFNIYLQDHQWQVRSDLFWRRVREEFIQVARLVHRLDEILGILVVLSFLNNVVIICQQLLRSLRPRSTIIQQIYFIWSFGFLICRTVMCGYNLSEIHTRSKGSLSVLFSVPSESFSHHVKRLLVQMDSDQVAITGCGLFTVNRATIFTIAGTIVTYEFVLLQFNVALGIDNDWKSGGNRTFCNFLRHIDG